MVIRCKTTKLEDTKSAITNSNMDGYLKIGENYTVLGIRMFKDVIYYTVFLEQHHLIEVPSDLFKIIDNKVSSLWEIRDNENGISFWPSLFYNDDFFENFSEWNHKERTDFAILIKSF